MERLITCFLLSIILLLPASNFAQQSSDSPNPAGTEATGSAGQPLHSTKPARRNAAFQSTLSAVKDYCSKHKDNPACKSDSTMYNAASKLVEKNAELQAYIETGVLPDMPIKFDSLPPPDKSDPDTSDKSWMAPALEYQRHEGPSAVPSSVKSLQSAVSEAESAISKLENLTPRQLGENIAHDIQFPDRAQWEQRLYEKRQKVIVAARAYLAVAKSTTDTTLARSTKYDFDIEMVGYNDLATEGLAKAADWERR
jgi:hypothetical protein